MLRAVNYEPVMVQISEVWNF
uniref:Uncharacterized protein n=1 Tax=Arundo donax TaxID=35708 RepID=A0A0A8Y925_ARUDO